KQAAALDTILNAKTQLCNDILMAVASDSSHEMHLRAVKGLGDLGGSDVLEYLSGLLSAEDTSTRNIAARALSTLASHSKWSSVGHKIPASATKTSISDISKINQILNTLIAKDMPVAMIEDTILALVTQDSENAVDILTRLLAKPQISIKKAVIKSSKLLERDSAASVIREALEDESPEIVALAEEELNSRWPDEIWT
ncbi:MAG: HEAT repeat domain-containing protein, partial [Candidatus Odinarchaeota archaeon]